METRVAKINTVESSHTKSVRTGIGHLKTTELTACGKAEDGIGASQASALSVSQPRREKLPGGKIARDVQVTVPVLGSDPVKIQTRFSKPMMPCHPARARQLMKKGAKKKWFKSILTVQMPSYKKGHQQIVCGIDPGLKREAFTIQSNSHTYINILSDAVTGIHDKMVIRRSFRIARRGRKCPCRAPRPNRLVNTKWTAPSIKSRWNAKIRIIDFLRKIYPISDYVIEDIRAVKRPGAKKWNRTFSVLEMGKTRFYKEIITRGNLITKKGFDTHERRIELGFKKTSSKMTEEFNAHNVDSWVLASFITGKTIIDNSNVLRMIPFKFNRRKLHSFWNRKGGIRDKQYGTRVAGFKKGSIIKHRIYGYVYIGGLSKSGLFTYNLGTDKELPPYKNILDFKFFYYSGWRFYWLNNIKINHKLNFIGGHNFRDPENRAMGGQTRLEKYGDAKFTNRDEAKKTCLKKYGVDNVAKIDEVIKKRVNTCLQKYGRVFNHKKEKFKIPDSFKAEFEKGLTLEELSKKFNVSVWSVSDWTKRLNLKRAPIKKIFIDFSDCSCTKNFSPTDEEKLFKATKKVYDSYRRCSRALVRSIRNFPLDASAIEKHYGSWNSFLRAVGLPIEYNLETPYQIVEDYLNFCKKKERFLSFHSYGVATEQAKKLKLKRVFKQGSKYAYLSHQLKDVWNTDFKEFLGNFNENNK